MTSSTAFSTQMKNPSRTRVLPWGETEVAGINCAKRLSTPKWAIAVFAHNEELTITSSLESIRSADGAALVHAYVLINGCTDQTERVVREFAVENDWVRPLSIEIGDKANAWNVFVHQVTESYSTYFFLDGDVEMEVGALNALHQAMVTSPTANAAAAIPSSGRNREQLIRYVTESRLILGNLYALRGEFVQHIRREGVRIPIGYIGDDGIVTSLVKWDLDPTGEFRHERVVPCVNARFKYRSLSPLSLRDLRLYWRRRVRYSQRHYQHELLVPILTTSGIRAMPKSVADLYSKKKDCINKLCPRNGLDMLFDRIAIGEIRASLKTSGSS